MQGGVVQMAGQDKKLNNLSYQVLGVLARQPRSGYDIVKQLEHFRPAKTSQVYPTLAKLEELGLVASQDVAQTSRPNKRLYTVTDQGQQELIAWIGTEPDVPYHRDDFLTMVYSAWLKSPEDTIAMFEVRLADLDRVMEQLQKLIGVIISDFPESLSDPTNWRFYRYNLQHRRLLLAQTEQTWCRAMVHQLQKHID